MGAKEPIRRIRVDHHWFCLDVLRSPDCQSAAVLLLAPPRATGSRGWLKTNTPVLGALFVVRYLIVLEEEVLTTNPARATQREHTIISYQWIEQQWEKAFCGTRTRVMVGMFSCHEHCFGTASLPCLACNCSSTIELRNSINIDFRHQRGEKINVDDAFVAMGWTLHLPSGTLSLVRSLAHSLSSQNSQVRRNCCYCAVCQCVVDALIIPRVCLMLRKHSNVFMDSFLFWYSWYDSVGGLYWQLLTWCSYVGSGE